ncbi:sodium:proline symporter [Tropicimonas sp. S265A]|uniref:sodium:proline symporter n=1 Tax=Tropicimonas sp. S265A TaxID=3415134 RepID=UPI003C7B146C
MMTIYVGLAFVLVAAASVAVAPRRATVDGFFGGRSAAGAAPGLWTLVLSQVTTWIFARSLMNAAILGYFYGMPGTLAYAAYYGSFLTGGFIVARIRAQGGRSVQAWLGARFGATGTGTYNIVIALRLLSEVFANLLVVGLIFDALVPQSGAGTIAILAVAVLGLAYSAWGGLSAALRTDVVQMLLFLVVFGIAFYALITSAEFDLAAVLSAEGTSGTRQGWILLAVAALQVFSYPAHDPVMMDRGFLADRKRTAWSFLHAFWISSLCIIGFGMFGIQASLTGAEYEGQLLGTWATMFPGWVWALLMLSLLISALSTLDSALSSSARVMVEELRLLPRTLAGGRIAMVGFMAAGTALTLWGNATLFDAVAVSGTASMFLTPVLVAGLILKRDIPLWSYLVSFAAAIGGALVYFWRDTELVVRVLPEAHKYDQLLWICVAVLAIGFVAVGLGLRGARVAPAE